MPLHMGSGREERNPLPRLPMGASLAASPRLMRPDFRQRIPQSLTDAWVKGSPALRATFRVLLVVMPAIALARLIWQHAVNIPFLDDWMFVQMDDKAAQGTLTWKDFFIVQMEHRMAFVRGVIMLCHQWFPANYTAMMWITWAFLLGTALNVFLLLRRTTGAKFAYFWPVMLLASLAIFTPVQYQIVLWSMMFQVAAPAFFLSLSFVLALSPRPLWLRFIVGVIGAACSTLCFATGILLWVLPLPLLFLPGVIRSARAKWIYTGLWLAVFAVAMGLYFNDLKNETDPQFSYKQGDQETMGRNFQAFFSEPGKGMVFVMRLLGCHLARGTSISAMDSSLVIGGLSCLLWVGAALYWWRRFADEKLRRALLPWLLFGAYSIGAAGLIAVGRVWATRTGENAITARYVIHAVPLTVSLIVLVWMIVRDLRRNHPEWRKHLVQTLAAAGFALAILQVISWSHGMRMMTVWESSRLRGAANTLFYNTVNNTEGDIAANRKLARRANELGLLNPPMLADTRLENFRLTPQLLSQTTAQLRSLTIERVQDEEDKDVIYGLARGFASLPGRERVADAVIFTYRVPQDGRWEIFHVAQVMGLPLYLLDTLSRDMQFIHVPGEHFAEEGVAGFEARFDFRQLPAGDHEVMAWAYDHREGRVFPMSGYFRVHVGQTRIKKLGSDPRSVHLDKFLEAGKEREKRKL